MTKIEKRQKINALKAIVWSLVMALLVDYSFHIGKQTPEQRLYLDAIFFVLLWAIGFLMLEKARMIDKKRLDYTKNVGKITNYGLATIALLNLAMILITSFFGAIAGAITVIFALACLWAYTKSLA